MIFSAELTGLTTASGILLLLAVVSLWIKRYVALGVLGLATVVSGVAGHVTFVGALCLAGFAGLAWWYRQSGGWSAWAALVIASAVFFLHLVPGITGWPILGPMRIGAGAEYGKWLSVDKVGAGVLLLAVALPDLRSRADWRVMLVQSWPWIVGVPLLLAILAVLSGSLHLDVTPVAAFWPWAVVNLLSVCVVEEALFRGLIQSRLVHTCRDRRLPALAGVVLAALLFGLAHAAGGVALVVFATLAGLGYGFARHVTGRIEAAILVHFALNAVHFSFLTYPVPA
ncbi:lysostaphin resistance A-like protein [Amaricoccus tamworthensis]|uniref:CPBP family intramembrane glutamic endopeptidase n=1 Tax=Amaricoccus tamworthensis TaxID=57002 RepID=UPI003C7CA8F4